MRSTRGRALSTPSAEHWNKPASSSYRSRRNAKGSGSALVAGNESSGTRKAQLDLLFGPVGSEIDFATAYVAQPKLRHPAVTMPPFAALIELRKTSCGLGNKGARK